MLHLIHTQFGVSSTISVVSWAKCVDAPNQCADNGYTPYYGCVHKANPDEGVECKPQCPILTSGSVQITSDCYLYSQIVVTGKLNVTGIPDAQGNLPKIIGGGSNRLFKVESGGKLVVRSLNLTGGDVSGNDGTDDNDLGGAVYVKNGTVHTVGSAFKYYMRSV